VQPPAAPPTGQAPAAEDVASLPPWAQKKLADANAEAAKARVTAKENAAKEERDRILALLSPDAAEPLTPEQLQQQLAEARTQGTTAQQAAAAAAIELSVFRTAQRLGANADALLDSRTFCDGIDALDIDPSDTAAFTAAVTEKVNAALAANPALRAGPTAGRSGGDMGGGGGSGDGALTLDAQIEAAQKAGNIGLSMRLKRHRAAQQTT
jgi:hypothetical protein